MTPEQILQVNEQMAKICGKKYSVNTEGKGFAFYDGTWDLFAPHSDWNHLMEVVEKIESIHDDFHGYFGVHIYSNGCTIQGTNLRTDPDNPHYAYFITETLDTKHNATYYVCAQFIEWYNKNLLSPGTQSPSGSIPNRRG